MTMVVKQLKAPHSLHGLRALPAAACEQLGCTHTLQEILHQPRTWRETIAHLISNDNRKLLAGALSPPPSHIVLTGSGSSLYVGECLAPVLQAELGIPCRAVAAGTLLTGLRGNLPRGGGLLVSIARSGNSPESAAVVDAVLETFPEYRHLAITCNADGQLATRYTAEPRMRALLLDPSTDDRSLVMTSSFTNLLLAGSALLPGVSAAASGVVEALFEKFGDALADWGSREFDAVAYLGSGASLGAAHETALKMLEMSGGQVRVLAESSLGLRHGPMAWLNRPSLLVAFLAGDAQVRAYEIDLLRELSHKHLGVQRIVVGEGLDADVVGAGGLAVDLPGLYALAPVQGALVHTVVGQLLALFHCLAQGQRPDAPSQGVLTRVVAPFALHGERHA
jgi:tagatose-6-phosphate ketose/aldose isomerase